FRGKFAAALQRRFQQCQLIFPGSLRPLQNEKAFRAFLRPLFRQNWIVYAKPPFGGPHHVLAYLARYTHRVAITNHRLAPFDGPKVTFGWKDYAKGNQKRMRRLAAPEFLRRFYYAFCPVVLFASAPSASCRTVAGPLFCRSLNDYCWIIPSHQPLP